MKQPGLIKEERRGLAAWMTSAFTMYATVRAGSGLSCVPGETRHQHQARIQAYGRAFSGVLLGKIEMDDITKLLDDLNHLRKANCPALDLIELMLLCTEDFSMSIADLLLRVGISTTELSALQGTLNRTADTVAILNQRALPRPLDYVEEKFQDIHEQHRVRELIESLPEALRYLSVLLSNYPPESDQLASADEKHFALGWIYLLVNHYGPGYPAVSHLLKAMRCARRATSQAIGAQGLRYGNKASDRIEEQKEPLSESAIERRLARYWRVIGKARRLDMEIMMTMYTEFSTYETLRRGGATFLTLLVHLERDWKANAPRIFAKVAAQNTPAQNTPAQNTEDK
jgi:hypothetical protein